MKAILKSILVLSALIFLFNVTAIANGEGDETKAILLSGKVIDQATNESLAGVKIILIGTDKVTYSDLEGNFEFKDIETGTYSIHCSYISYEVKVIEEVTVCAENAKNIEVHLSSN